MKNHLLRERRQRAIKINMSLHVVFEKAIDSTVVTGPPIVLVAEQFEVYAATDIEECLQQYSHNSTIVSIVMKVLAGDGDCRISSPRSVTCIHLPFASRVGAKHEMRAKHTEFHRQYVF